MFRELQSVYMVEQRKGPKGRLSLCGRNGANIELPFGKKEEDSVHLIFLVFVMLHNICMPTWGEEKLSVPLYFDLKKM